MALHDGKGKQTHVRRPQSRETVIRHVWKSLSRLLVTHSPLSSSSFGASVLIHIPSEAMEGRLFHSACFCGKERVTLFHSHKSVPKYWHTMCAFDFLVKVLLCYYLPLSLSDLSELSRVGLVYIIPLACDSFCPCEFVSGKIEFTRFMALLLLLPAVTTEDASLSPEQSTEGVEPPGEPLPVEFQVSLHSIPLLWSLSLLFRVCPHFFLSSHFRGSWKSHLENWTKVIFPWRLEALWGAHAGALNLGGICMNDISHYEAVITKQINVGRKEMRSYYCNF